jgi:hypothetical protein
VKRTRDVTGRTGLALAALVLSLAGCSALSPTVITTPYPAADGVQLDLPGTDVKLRDFLVIGTEKGAPASVLGSVVNDGSTPVRVSLQSDPGESAQPTQTVVPVEAHGSVLIGPDQEIQMAIPQLPVPPGGVVTLSAATGTGGTASFQLPVLRPEGFYAGMTPAPTTAAPTPTTSSKAKAKSSDDEDQPTGSGDDPTSEPTPTDG